MEVYHATGTDAFFSFSGTLGRYRLKTTFLGRAAFSTTLKDDLQYTPSDCFETFPFPMDRETNVFLETLGKEYYEFRARLMLSSNEGLTKTTNRFHDPEETSPEILRLRELHAQMDSAVLTAYGWDDLLPRCQCLFLLDYEDDEDEEDNGRGRKHRKPWRYRWPDDVRDEVLARLLILNGQRAEEEWLTGIAEARSTKKRQGESKGAFTRAAEAAGQQGLPMRRDRDTG